jgi:hypothetical protein
MGKKRRKRKSWQHLISVSVAFHHKYLASTSPALMSALVTQSLLYSDQKGTGWQALILTKANDIPRMMRESEE